jgi:integrase
VLAACAKHDADTFVLTRDEHDGFGTPGTRYKSVTAFVRFLLLTGMRVSEALAIEWRDVEAEQIHVRSAVSKTKQPRDVDLTVAPTALPGEPRARLFELTAGEVRAAQRRTTTAKYGAPKWSPHVLRRTCWTYFTCAFNPRRSAKPVGHSVVIAERHCAGLVKVPAGGETLEQAIGIASERNGS